MKEGAERICRRILADARSQAESIEAEALQRKEAILAEGQKEAEKRQKEILERAQKEAEELKRRILGMAQLDARKEMLAAKQELIEEAFQGALESLSNLDDPAYLDVLRRMLLDAVKTGDEVVILSSRDRARIPDNFWEDLKKELSADGKAGKLTVEETETEISGGFILQSGGVEINNTFAALLEMYRDELEVEVASLLFRES